MSSTQLMKTYSVGGGSFVKSGHNPGDRIRLYSAWGRGVTSVCDAQTEGREFEGQGRLQGREGPNKDSIENSAVLEPDCDSESGHFSLCFIRFNYPVLICDQNNVAPLCFTSV